MLSLEFGVKVQASACLRLGPDWLKPVVPCHAQDKEIGSVSGHFAESTSKRYDRRIDLFPCSVSGGGPEALTAG